MIIGKSSNWTSINQYGDKEDQFYQRSLARDLDILFSALQGRIRFGSGTSGQTGENIGGVWVKVLTSGTSNAETGVKHVLGSQPMGYLVMWRDKPAILYGNPQGGGTNTVWTSGTAYFKSNTSSGTFMVFLLERGGQ